MTAPTKKTYIAVFVWLMVLTVVEIVVAGMAIPRTALVIFLIGTAIAKALLIALYFMHLRFENIYVWLLPIIPVLLAVFFVGMLFPDIVYHLTMKVH